MKDKIYDPSIQALLGQCQLDWGNPHKNRVGLIPYGIREIDKALYGIDPEGELIVIQGKEKVGKTRFLANIVANYMTSMPEALRPPTNIDTLESGMRPPKYRDLLISIMGTRWLLSRGHIPLEECPLCNTPFCKELNLSPLFLKYNTRSEAQLEAIQHAIDEMMTWPLYIHGAGLKEGNTRDIQAAGLSTTKQKARWERLVEEHGMRILVVDHGQQYQYQDDPTDYEKLLRAISIVGDFTTQHNIATLFISQVSLTSRRENRSGGRLYAAGGAKAAQEANTVISIDQPEGGGQLKIVLEESRHSGSFSIYQRVEDISGCLFGETQQEPFVVPLTVL